jgi:phage terminase large subunit-like protein
MPQVVATTTPRPIPLLKDLLAQKDQPHGTAVTRGSTYDNYANLAPGFIARVITTYEGTRLGRQELYAELLEDMPGALWTRALLEETRVQKLPLLRRIGIGVDPGGDAGIIAAGVGEDGHGYVFDDLSMSGSPLEWGKQVMAGYGKHRANLIVFEKNHGADMGKTILTSIEPKAVIKEVWASQGKYARAEPVAAIYEQKRIHHVGMFAALEDELCSWVPGEGMPSPNRLDAAVWILTELLLGGEPRQARAWGRHSPGTGSGADNDGRPKRA